MRKLLLAAVAVFVTAFSANAQVKIESPHPDLDIKITRCAYASGTVVIDMVITNFGPDEVLGLRDGNVSAYDDDGNGYNGNNSEIRYGFVNQGLKRAGGGSSTPTFAFPQDVPLKFRIQLSNINNYATKFSLLSIGFSSQKIMGLDVKKPLKFRNLEWVK